MRVMSREVPDEGGGADGAGGQARGNDGQLVGAGGEGEAFQGGAGGRRQKVEGCQAQAAADDYPAGVEDGDAGGHDQAKMAADFGQSGQGQDVTGAGGGQDGFVG
jgi:hypothetical protein